MIETKQAIISQGVILLQFKPDKLNGLSDKTPGAEEVILLMVSKCFTTIVITIITTNIIITTITTTTITLVK